METTGGQLIGNSISKKGQTHFTAFNPATGTPLAAVFHEATEAEINEAVALADAAFWQYRKKTGAERAAFLEAIADEITALGDELIKTAALETALPEARITGERGRTVGQLRLFAGFIRDDAWLNTIEDPAQPDRQPLPRPRIVQKQVPLGVVAVFGASNFPLAFSVAGGDTVSALAAGCPVVFKAHPAHPATCELVGRAIVEAARRTAMPEGVCSMVHGTGHGVGRALVTHPLVKAVAFTGSYRGGKALYDLAVRRDEPIPVYAEMGSTNPVFFLEGAFKKDTAALADAFVASVTQGAGQFCTNPGVFVVGREEVGFVSQVAGKLAATPAGHLLTEGIKTAYVQGIARQRQTAGTVALTDWDGQSPQPHLLQTTVAAALENPELTEEVFGPSTVAVLAGGPDEMLAFARSLKGHLTATIFGTEEDLAANAELLDILATKVGRLVFNGLPTGVEVCHAMVHGGPFPATTDARTTSVGTQAAYRFTRPVAFQGFPERMV